MNLYVRNLHYYNVNVLLLALNIVRNLIKNKANSNCHQCRWL